VKDYVAGNEDALAINQRHESKIYGFIYSKIPDRDITNDFPRHIHQSNKNFKIQFL
jgi:hypothetical protein